MARRKPNLLLNLLILLSLTGSLLFSSSPVHAATVIEVRTNVDEFNQTGTAGDCSLREAIYAANNDIAWGGCAAGSGYDTIVFRAPNPVYQLTLGPVGSVPSDDSYGDLDIYSGMQILGNGSNPGGTVISGQFQSRIFEIFTPTQVNIQHLRIQDGKAVGNTITDQNGAGGGIYNLQSLLTLFDVVLDNNEATNSGGGVYSCFKRINCKLNISNSTISNNKVSGDFTDSGGGGIMSKGPLVIMNSLIEKNTTDKTSGGGLYNQSYPEGARLVNVTFSKNEVGRLEPDVANFGAAIYSAQNLELINNTIAENIVYNPGATALDLEQSSVIINTLLVENWYQTTSRANCHFATDPYGTNNYKDDDAVCSQFEYKDSINLSTGEALSQNGGKFTMGYRLKDGSSAIDTGALSYPKPGGPTFYCPGSDYRWAIRPMTGKAGPGGCDVGAYEANDYVTGLPIFRFVALPIISR